MIAIIFICLSAIVHFYFMYLEMFAWEAPRTLKIFGNTKSSAKATKIYAANQGLYNGAIAGGLLLSLWMGSNVMLYYLLASIIAFGIYAYFTVTKKALYVQSAPAAIAVLALYFGV